LLKPVTIPIEMQRFGDLQMQCKVDVNPWIIIKPGFQKSYSLMN
jgi:hypothetical protein